MAKYSMKSLGIAELEDRLSEHLRAVELGAEVLVTDRNRPIARIVPVSSSGHRILQLMPPQVAFSSVRVRKWRAAGWKLSSDALLGRERADR